MSHRILVTYSGMSSERFTSHFVYSAVKMACLPALSEVFSDYCWEFLNINSPVLASCKIIEKKKVALGREFSRLYLLLKRT